MSIDPITREEVFLAALSDGGIQTPDPITRTEMFLAAAVGNTQKDRAALVELVDSGAKSILPNNAVSGTLNQVAFTVNTDKSVKANGTASTAAWFELSSGNTLKKGAYVISGGEPSVRVVLSTALTATAIIAQSQGAPTEFTLDSDTSGLYFSVRMSTGASAENVTVYPIICKKSLWEISQKYVPYCPSMAELYDMVLSLQ